MKKIVLVLLLTMTSCFPSMQIGPEPHSTKYNQEKFEHIISQIKIHSDKTKTSSKALPESLINEMKEVGFLEYRDLGDYKIFFCGYGVVGKGWGFLNGKPSQLEMKSQGLTIEGNNNKLHLTYLEHIAGDWFRFGAI